MEPTLLVETPQIGLAHVAVLTMLCMGAGLMLLMYGAIHSIRRLDSARERDAFQRGLKAGMEARKSKADELGELPEYDDLELGIAYPTDGELVQFEEKS